MPDQSPQADDPQRIAILALLMAYGQTGDPAAQTEILRSLARQLSASDLAGGPARLRDWVAGLPPPDLAASPDYARYEELVPQMLAGLLPAGDPDHAWFLAFLARSEWAAEEYADLQQTMAAEQAARLAAPDTRILHPTFDTPARPLLAVAESGAISPPAPDAESAWRTPLRADQIILRRSGDHLRQVEVLFARDPTIAPPALDTPSAPTKQLLAGPLPSEPGLDPSQHYQVTALAIRQGPPICTVRVQITAAGPVGGVSLRLRSAGGQEWFGFTTAQGVMDFAAIPVTALNGMTLLIDLDQTSR